MTDQRLRALAPGVALAALALLQPWLERSMPMHMLVELPLLFALGWRAAAHRHCACLARANAHGLPGLTFAMSVSAFWMLPIALDVAVLQPAIGWTKVASIVLAGGVARWSFVQARLPVQAFFVLNWAWMTGVVGVLYQEAPERLCNAYLAGDQARAGAGLVVLAVVVAVAWTAMVFRAIASPSRVAITAQRLDAVPASRYLAPCAACRMTLATASGCET